MERYEQEVGQRAGGRKGEGHQQRKFMKSCKETCLLIFKNAIKLKNGAFSNMNVGIFVLKEMNRFSEFFFLSE